MLVVVVVVDCPLMAALLAKSSPLVSLTVLLCFFSNSGRLSFLMLITYAGNTCNKLVKMGKHGKNKVRK